MKTVLVTGANRGIGLEFTRRYLANGSRVIATCRNPSDAYTLQILEKNKNLSILELDVAAQLSVDHLESYLKGIPIDILINNAGVTGGGKQPFESIDCDVWLQTLSINTLGPMRVSLALLENLRIGSSPRIVSISSEVASMVHPSRSFYAYSSSKAALNKAMQHLAASLENEGIIVGLLHPGWVQTDMGGVNGKLTVEESVEGLVEVIDSLTMKNNGQFITWEGVQHPW
ncbi:MAG: SDR family oxidoreductase [Granulosicoccus sp.]